MGTGASRPTTPDEEKAAAMLLDANNLLQQRQYEAAFAIFEQVRQTAVASTPLDETLGGASDVLDESQIRSLRIENSVLSGLGATYAMTGEYSNAIWCFDQASAVTAKIGERQVEGNRLSNLGICYVALGRYQESVEYFTQAAAIRHEIGDSTGQCSLLRHLGCAQHRLGQFDVALGHLKAALEISQTTGDHAAEVTILGSMGAAWFSLNEHDRSLNSHLAALAISREMYSGCAAQEGAILATLGECYRALGQYENAIDRYSPSIELVELSGCGRQSQALAFARETGDSALEARVYNNLGWSCIGLGECDTAIGHFSAALSIHCEYEDWAAEAEALACIGMTQLQGLGNAEGAIPWLLQALAALEGVMREAALDQRLTLHSMYPILRLLQEAQFKLGTHTIALEFAEYAQCHAFEMLLALQHLHHTALTGDTSTALSLQAHDFATLRAFVVKRRVAVVIFSLIDGGVLVWVLSSTGMLTSRYLPILPEEEGSMWQLVSTVQTADVDCTQGNNRRQVQSPPSPVPPLKLDLYECVYCANFRGTYDAVELHERTCGHNPPAQLSESPKEAAAASEMDRPAINHAAVDQLLHRCYQLLIEPLVDVLDPEQRLVLIANGDLSALPFAGLCDDGGRYLVEKHILHTAPSIGALIDLECHCTPQQSQRPVALVPGDADGLLEAFSTDADSFFLPYNIDFMRAELTKEALIAALGKSTYVHLDAGYFEAGGIVSPGELQQLKLECTELVVLSHEANCAGTAGAFLAAGAPGVLMPLWSVKDDAALALLDLFYEYLLGEAHCDAAAALQQAMVSMIKGRNYSVMEWAPFVLHGLGAVTSKPMSPPPGSARVGCGASECTVCEKVKQLYKATPGTSLHTFFEKYGCPSCGCLLHTEEEAIRCAMSNRHGDSNRSLTDGSAATQKAVLQTGATSIFRATL